jgi:predicted RNA methylase
LDFGAGSGLVAIAAAKAGARPVVVAEIDPFAAAAIAVNAALNDAEVETSMADLATFQRKNGRFEGGRIGHDKSGPTGSGSAVEVPPGGRRSWRTGTNSPTV